MRRSTAAGAMQMATLFAMGEIPGIIRRSAPCDGSGVGIGISFPLFEEGSRLRFATSVAAESIRAVQTPCDIIDLPFDTRVKPLRVLSEIKQALPEWQGRIGVFGASALQSVTRLPYLHEGSDIDLIFNGGSPEALFEAHRVLQKVESLSGIRIDAEVTAGRKLGIKLCELFRNQKTVLAKTINSVEVLDRNEVLSLLGAVWQSAI
jgi:phosphoribosyl-dephospho-CoA transferase